MPSNSTRVTRPPADAHPLTPEIAHFVHAQGLGFVASVNADGTPNLSPKGSIVVVDPDHLAFVDLRSPTTTANLWERPTAEVSVVDPLRRRGYRFRGRAELLGDGPEFDAIVAHYRSCGFTPPIEIVVRIRVERVVPVTSPAYDRGTTEEELVRAWTTRLGVEAPGIDAVTLDASSTADGERALNAMIVAGEYRGALDRFYAHDVVMCQADGSETAGLAVTRAREAALFGAGVCVTARLTGGAVAGTRSYSEWECRLGFPSGRVLAYPQVVARAWRDGRVTHERRYHEPFPGWTAEEIRAAHAQPAGRA